MYPAVHRPAVPHGCNMSGPCSDSLPLPLLHVLLDGPVQSTCSPAPHLRVLQLKHALLPGHAALLSGVLRPQSGVQCSEKQCAGLVLLVLLHAETAGAAHRCGVMCWRCREDPLAAAAGSHLDAGAGALPQQVEQRAVDHHVDQPRQQVVPCRCTGGVDGGHSSTGDERGGGARTGAAAAQRCCWGAVWPELAHQVFPEQPRRNQARVACAQRLPPARLPVAPPRRTCPLGLGHPRCCLRLGRSLHCQGPPPWGAAGLHPLRGDAGRQGALHGRTARWRQIAAMAGSRPSSMGDRFRRSRVLVSLSFIRWARRLYRAPMPAALAFRAGAARSCAMR